MLRWMTMFTLLAPLPLAAARAQLAGDPYAPLVREGLARNRGVLQARLGVRQREAEVRRATGAFLPSIDLDARWSELSGVLDLGAFVNPAYAALNEALGEDRFPTDLSITQPFAQDMRVRLTQPLFNGALYANHALQRALRDAEAGRLAAAERALAAGVQLTALRVASAERAVAIWTNARTLVEENLRVSERLVAAGSATPDAVARARADLADAEQQQADAERERAEARRALNDLLRRPLESPLPPLPEPADAAAPPLALDGLLGEAAQRREDLLAADAATRAAGAQVRLAGAAFLPTVALAVDYGFQGSELRFTRDNDFVVGSIVVQWNLFRGGQDGARRTAAKLERERAVLEREAAAARVEREVRDAVAAVAVAGRAVSAAEARLAAARRTFELVSRRYEEGLAPHLEFSDARTRFTNADLNAALTRFALAARLVELERAAALRDLSS